MMEKGASAKQVYFISMVGVNEYGVVDEHEHIFDIFTKTYDFIGSNVQVISAQDLWKFYCGDYEEGHLESKSSGEKVTQLEHRPYYPTNFATLGKIGEKILFSSDRRIYINIYQLVEFFIHHHPNGHYVVDECPFLEEASKQ